MSPSICFRLLSIRSRRSRLSLMPKEPDLEMHQIFYNFLRFFVRNFNIVKWIKANRMKTNQIAYYTIFILQSIECFCSTPPPIHAAGFFFPAGIVSCSLSSRSCPGDRHSHLTGCLLYGMSRDLPYSRRFCNFELT